MGGVIAACRPGQPVHLQRLPRLLPSPTDTTLGRQDQDLLGQRRRRIVWESLKRECLQGRVFATRADARRAIFRWINWYNTARLHTTLNGVPPARMGTAIPSSVTIPVRPTGRCPSPHDGNTDVRADREATVAMLVQRKIRVATVKYGDRPRWPGGLKPSYRGHERLFRAVAITLWSGTRQCAPRGTRWGTPPSSPVRSVASTRRSAPAPFGRGHGRAAGWARTGGALSLSAEGGAHVRTVQPLVRLARCRPADRWLTQLGYAGLTRPGARTPRTQSDGLDVAHRTVTLRVGAFRQPDAAPSRASPRDRLHRRPRSWWGRVRGS